MITWRVRAQHGTTCVTGTVRGRKVERAMSLLVPLEQPLRPGGAEVALLHAMGRIERELAR